MKNLVKELIKENEKILHTYPNIDYNLKTSAGHRYMFNKEIIGKLELLIIADVSQRSELLSRFLVQYNQNKLTSSDEMDIDLFLNDNKPT
tara:strand:+ start:1334 stop:1603 length:270 start_codon:yes stop_codon:yes gene_type:complete